MYQALCSKLETHQWTKSARLQLMMGKQFTENHWGPRVATVEENRDTQDLTLTLCLFNFSSFDSLYKNQE